LNSNDAISKPTSLSREETEALNKHGVFFKKRILHALQEIPNIGILSEELGVSFGGTRVIDIVARYRGGKPDVFLVFECKRAYAPEKRWVFFKDVQQRYRLLRVQSGLMGHSSVFANREPPNPPVCSEGYEYRKNDQKADQNPIFQSAAQLSAGYLGFIARRHSDFNRPGKAPSDAIERYVAVMVTNAELVVVQQDLRAVSFETGNIPAPPNSKQFDYLILKHPFPTPEGIHSDFRDNPNPFPTPKDWNQLHKECIYVVHSTALSKFMSQDHLEFLRTGDSEE
jgi:hypothetical protein